MGYTHYWYRPETIPEPAWTAIRADVAKMIAASPIPVVRDHELIDVPAEVSELQILFNGLNGAGHEPFRLLKHWIPRPGELPKDDGLWFSSCKTAWKPYDMLV